jgi:hypothetical protein
VIPSPVDVLPTPEKLTARVVDPKSRRLHGFEISGDVARHYDFAELVLIALTGEPPSKPKGALFNELLVHASIVHVGHASVHAAVLARLCDAPPAGLFAVAALGVGQQSHRELGASDDADSAPLADVLQRHGVELAEPRESRAALLAAGFEASGLAQRWQQEVALSIARLPVAMAEAMAASPGDFGDYPIRVPAFEYEDES